jgi:hypothetical protein
MISKSGSEQRWMKVVDTDANNEIVGVGQFLVYEGKKPESVLNLQRPGGYYDSDEDKEFAESLLVSFMERRKAVLEEVGDKPLVGEWVSFPSCFFFVCVWDTTPPRLVSTVTCSNWHMACIVTGMAAIGVLLALGMWYGGRFHDVMSVVLFAKPIDKQQADTGANFFFVCSLRHHDGRTTASVSRRRHHAREVGCRRSG